MAEEPDDDGSALLQVDLPMEDEVLNFVTEQSVYSAYTGRGLRLDIIRTSTHQPPIVDAEEFRTFMFLEARQGFFLLSQQFVKGAAQRWVVYRELIPKDSFDFYKRFSERLSAYIERHPPTC
jgi:hypothetical protein